MKSYAGIGSRQTPERVLWLMFDVGHCLARDGWTLRSGGALGADKAFERGALSIDGEREIFLADGQIPDAAFDLAEEYHPAWDRCSTWPKRLHARNGQILLGADLTSPVRFVLCWTRDGGATGGTGQALRVAAGRGITVFNLHDTATFDRLNRYVQSTCKV